MGNPSHTSQLGKLNRVSGQIQDVKRLINDHCFCVDIVTQLRAARNALKEIELSVLETHMKTCLNEALRLDEADREIMTQDIISLLKKYD